MSKFRKKPVVIDAWQFAGDDWTGCPDWLRVAICEDGKVWSQCGPDPYCTIATLEGEMRANPGDWIIRGVKGELHPCKPDIFEATYEPT